MPDMTQKAALEQYIVEHLDEAVEKRWIKPYFQPVIRTVTRQLCGMEALARWEDPVWGLLPPGSFIEVLERHRLIHKLDTCILRQVCELYREAVSGRGVLLPVSINLSRLDYELCDIFEVVEEAVQENRMPRTFLCIEITESALNENGDIMHHYIDQFRAAGYQVWMDDFGSGYSSLNVLKDYIFDELKVDMWFLSDFHQRSRKILSSIVHMAKEIEIQTLVEGVETEEQFRFLRNIGFEKVQGYLFGKPMPYLDCIRHILDQGMSVEAPMHRGYYDELGKLDVLSATPFLSPGDTEQLSSGRDLNSIPLALVEMEGENVRLLLTNDAFDEASGGIDWLSVFGTVETDPSLRDALRMPEVPAHMKSLLEEAKGSGEGKLYFVEGEEYFELLAKRIAGHGELCSVLLRLNNLSREAELSRQENLDRGLRKLYAMYDRVSAVDLEKGSITPLFEDGREVRLPREEDLRALCRRYAEDWIFPEDRRRFLLLTDPETLAERVARSGQDFVCAHLRTRQFHGNYVWKLYVLLHINESVYYMMERLAESDTLDFLALTGGQEKGGQDVYSPGNLWRNFTMNGELKFFWKDEKRRFLGASRSFLDFYGFDNLNDILGKTDEDMNWHIHADAFKSDEWDVIRNGTVTHNEPGFCIIRGENRKIFASKMPLYNRNGTINGLLGYFFESDEMPDAYKDGIARSNIDALTGLLNARGISEEVYSYRDEYELRKVDFARIHISIADFSETNQKFGYDFGDNVIKTVAEHLEHLCKNRASLGRQNGSLFVALAQFSQRKELDRFLSRIRNISHEIRSVDGVAFSLYLSVGAALYSESENLTELSGQAQNRMLADHAGGSYSEQFLREAERMFLTHEDIPIPFAVIHLHRSKKGKRTEGALDATLIYANKALLNFMHRARGDVVGKPIRDEYLIPGKGCYDMARQAAESGKSASEWIYDPLRGLHILVTASQVIGPGYCALTFQADRRESKA